MKSYTLTAPAKINLHLEIVGIRPDNYHELVMIMQSIDLADRVEVRSIPTDRIILHCDRAGIPVDRTNLAYRAAELMQATFPAAAIKYGGVEITLHKQIPMAAGLAGGSGNAAAVLVGIDLLWELGLTKEELETLGSKLGSDVPFCVSGGTAIATGRGELLSPLAGLAGIFVVLGKYRNVEVSTPWAYGAYREQFGHGYVNKPTSWQERAGRIHAGDLVKAIVHRDPAKIGKLLHNDLEKVVLPTHPLVAQLKQEFERHPNLGTMMSGSGPTVFSLATDRSQAESIYEGVRAALPNPDLELFIARLCDRGISVAEMR
jgi:4-diphosphocytidyl-2-C-methyl-D-erythritol kinase